MLIPKEIIRPGKYWYADAESGQPRCLEATPELVRHLYDSGNAMRQSGLSIPIPLEHQLDNKPLTAQERAANNLLHNTGWVDSYILDEENRLFGMCEFDDKQYPDLVAKLPTTIKYTSPWITSFTDGNGKKWEGVIGHLALTSRPRITQQQPFPNVQAALSLSAPLAPVAPSAVTAAGLFLSRAGRLVSNNEVAKTLHVPLVPAYPMAFSVWSGVALAAPPPPKKKAPPPGEEDEGDVSAGEGGDAGGMMPPVAPGKGKDALKKMGLMDVAKDLLSALFDVELPEDADEKSLLQHLVQALMDRIKSQKGEKDMAGETDTTNGANNAANPAGPGKGAAPVVQETPPLYMSSAEVQKIEDPVQKRLAEVVLSLQTDLASERQRGSALATNVLHEAEKTRQRRIQELCKRLPAATREKLLAQAKGAQLSLTDDGHVLDPLEALLSLLEESTINIPILLSMQAQGLAPTTPITEQGQPRDMEPGRVTEERRKEIVEEQCRNTGLGRRETA